MIRIVLAGLVVFAASASAEVPSRSVYVGIYGGTQLQLTSWHLHEAELVDDTPGPSGVAGLRVGGTVHPLVAIEAAIGVIPFSSASDELNVALNYSADLHLMFFEGDWVPYLDLGAGLYHNIVGDHGSDVDYHVHYGIGLRGMLTDVLALRIDVRHAVSDGFLDELAHNLEMSVGIDFFAWIEQTATE